LSICLKRVIIWLVMTCLSIVVGMSMDMVFMTESFPVAIRLFGILGMVLAHFPLRRTGRLLTSLGEPKEWGCTSRLVTKDIYQCVRHPHHLGVSIFMTSLGLAIGHLWSFLVISLTQWIWVLSFLLLVEEKELMEKFGEDYRIYRQKVPMLFPKPSCVFRVFTRPIEEAKD